MGWRAVSLVALLTLAAPGAARADVVEVTGWQVNVRERPSRSAPVIVTLPRGERFALLGQVSSWYHVSMVPSGRPGYVHSSLVRVIPGVTLAAPVSEATPPVARPAAVMPLPPPPPPPPPAPAPTPRAVVVAPAPASKPVYTSPPPPVPTTAQATSVAEPQQREGFWIGFGGGYGSASVSFRDFPAEDRQGSYTGFLKLGGTLNPQLLLGVESNAWVKSEDDVTLVLGSLAGTVTYYPKATSGFFLKGGIGLSYMSSEIFLDAATVSVSKAGWGLLAGVGYDVRVGQNISITPSFNFYFGEPGEIRHEGVRAFSGWEQNVFDFGVGISFH
jgi:hypothetical protein